MATRPVFVPSRQSARVQEVVVTFEWFPGFSAAQKQRSVQSLHAAARERGISDLLEVSSKSLHPEGVALSAFNLPLETEGQFVPVEVAFQASKQFSAGHHNAALITMSPRDAKRAAASNPGRLAGFRFEGTEWPLTPRTAFYDWLYLKALSQNPDLAGSLNRYNGFTDIEFNPQKSINCQARSCALVVALSSIGVSFTDVSTKDAFLKLTDEEDRPEVQDKLFD